jgi:carbon monoxide dehydrogenase subunit G
MQLRRTIEVPLPPEEAFPYVADLSTTAAWDPSVKHAERLDEGPIGKGSEFRLLAVFGGRELRLRYVITEHEAPRRVVFEGEGATLNATDTVTFTPTGLGTRIDWRADLRFRSLLRLLEPLLRLPLQKTASRALAGLRDALSA